jgi:hypothetical protein
VEHVGIDVHNRERELCIRSDANGVLTPGSPGVAPYTETGARFELEASQFEVLDHRPIEAILGEILAAGATIDCYEPARGA